MLTLLWGLSGSGKSHALRQRALAPHWGQAKRILLVPEQFSHENERALAAMGGPSACLHTEVLTFNRLAARVLAAGGAIRQSLDAGGRLIALRRAVDQVADKLTVWPSAARRSEFIQTLSETVDELKCYKISPFTLANLARTLPRETGRRLRDLSLIVTAYDIITAEGGCDPRDIFTQLAQALDDTKLYQGSVWFVDGFARLTPLERSVVDALLGQAAHMTVALTGLPEPLPGRPDMFFSVARETARQFTPMAKAHGHSVTEEILAEAPRYRNRALAHLSACYGQEPPPAFSGAVAKIAVFEAPDRRRECETAAGLVRRLVREEGLRYRDIVIATRYPERYAPLMRRMAAYYDVPLFWDDTVDVLQHSLTAALLAALACVCYRYPWDSVFTYVKSGFAGVTLAQADRLENYALRYRFTERDWLSRRDWQENPRGLTKECTPEDQAELAALNDIRKKAFEPLRRLGEELSPRPLSQMARAFTAFLLDIALPDTLTARAAQLQENGYPQEAACLKQLWDIVTNALRQLALHEEERSVAPAEFLELFSLVLTPYQVGVIPVSLDRVTFSGIDRMRRLFARCVIFLGGEADFSPVTETGGLLGLEDRALLGEAGLSLAPDAEKRLSQEQDFIYTALALPSEHLYITYPRQTDEGATTLAPPLADVCQALSLPVETWEVIARETQTQAPGPCLSWAAGRRCNELLDCLRDSGLLPSCRESLGRTAAEPSLSPACAQQLYRPSPGAPLTLSPSRIEQFYNCPFSYFAKYGLALKSRVQEGFSPMDAGSFVHAVLEGCTRQVLEQGGFHQVTLAQLQAMARAEAERYRAQALRPWEARSARFARVFARLGQSLAPVLEQIWEEMRQSDFYTLDCELSLGRGPEGLPPVRLLPDVTLTGVVDRVDGWQRGDTLFLRVVDYKTGQRRFALRDLHAGLGLQLFAYLVALTQDEQALAYYRRRLPVTRIVPAGVLYMPAREALIQTDSSGVTETEIDRLKEKKGKRSGLLIDDQAVLQAMETGDTFRFLPVRYGKEGQRDARSSVAGAEDFAAAGRFVKEKIGQLSQSALTGYVRAYPLQWNGQLACDHCDYRAACQFDSRTDTRREPVALPEAAIWAHMRACP